MNLICEITDKDILGADGLSESKPRLTARAVLKNNDGLYAVMHGKEDFYTLPGGGVEEGEDKLTALKREVLEETGCECNEISELGYVYENRAHCNFTQCSYYYAVTTNGSICPPQLNDDEKKNKITLEWHTFDDAVKLISEIQHNTSQRKFIQARDTAALIEYKKSFK